MTGIVRGLGPDDWALLRGLRLAALADAPGAFGSSLARERDDAEAAWRERLARLRWFVAGAGIGLTAGAPSYEGVPGRRDLISMWVHPAHRGRRVAAVLVGAVRAWAVADGATDLALWVADGNASAARLYAREGFAPTGVRQPLPSDPTVGEEQWVLRLVP